MSAELSKSRSRRRLAGIVLFLLALTALALVAVPVWLIRPFVPQTPRGLAVAFGLRQWAPAATVLLLLAGLALTVALWRGGRWWSRALAALAIVPLLAAVWLARFNIYEKMFAPLDRARFVPVAEAKWVEEGDPVLAVTQGGEAAAYPIRQVAYHHIVQDVVGGVPVAVTY
jgi:hypothetical protein